MNVWVKSLLFRVAKRWISGETFLDALRRAGESNKCKISGIINLVGEDFTNHEEVRAQTEEYLEVLKAIEEHKVDACISVKPTQIGLRIGKELFKNNLERILQAAEESHKFVWLDMEASPYTTDTIDVYLELHGSHPNCGVAIQSNLKRSPTDLQMILDADGAVRLVKGAYGEAPEIAYRRKKEIDLNFSRLMRIMFREEANFAIATHDGKLIEEAIELSKGNRADFEFEMLMGIRDSMKRELAGRGYRVAEYIPYGRNWWPYSTRRIREHKSNILLLARSILGG